MPSINSAMNTMTPSSNGVAVQKVLASILADLTALTAAVNQLIVDYNANTNIVTDTTASAVTLSTTA